MGIFGSRKKTYVSSVVYNMAGDEMKRPNFMKTMIFSNVLNPQPSLSNAIVGSYIEGPGMRFRKFAQWARRTEYNDTIGLVTGNIQTGNNIDQEALIDELPVSPGSTANLQSANIGEANYTFWTDQYIAENFPERLTTAYTSDINDVTNEITITWVDTSTTSFMPVGYDPAGLYLYAVYTEAVPEVVEPPVEGDPVSLDPGDPWPDTTGWTEISEETIDDTTFTTYERETYMGQAPDRDAAYTLKETMIFADNPVLDEREYRIDTQITYHNSRSPMKVFIYKRGDGNAVLDAMFSPNENLGAFFPFIPFRLDNKFVSPSYLPEVYAQAKKGYKKATTGKFDELIESLEDNEDLGDIDYAYCVFGVSLNVIENASRKYIYKFFQEILNDYSGGGDGSHAAWVAAWNIADAIQQNWLAWKEAQLNPSNPLFGTPEPPQGSYPAQPTASIRVASDANTVMNYDMTISWSSLVEETGVGLLKPDAKRDELWFEFVREDDFQEMLWGEEDGEWKPIPGNAIAVAVLYLNWQVTPNTWRRLRIVGLKHRNLIYGGKSVDISAKEALEDGEESGFIIPLHEGVYRSMGLVDGTQMATACSFMVFNCYQVVKKKWYQTGIFAIIVIIIIVVVSIYFPPAGASAGGVLGTNVAVGTALGLAGTAAIVVGAIANALAAMLLTRMITTASTALFGDKWGAIIGAIAAVIALQVGTAMANGQTFANSFSGMMRAENILRLTSAAGNGYAQYLQASAAGYAQQTQQVLEDYKEESRKIREAWMQNIGTSRGIIDPLAITEAFGVTMESVNSFLQRTLMTGSDVAEMSLDMLTNFVDMTLSTELLT